MSDSLLPPVDVRVRIPGPMWVKLVTASIDSGMAIDKLLEGILEQWIDINCVGEPEEMPEEHRELLAAVQKEIS